MLKQNREQNGEDGEGGFDTTNILMSFTFSCFLSIQEKGKGRHGIAPLPPRSSVGFESSYGTVKTNSEFSPSLCEIFSKG